MRVLLLNPRKPYSIGSLPRSARLGGKRTLCSPLSLITVAALLPPEWDLRLIDLDAEELTEADWQWAELVMISGIIVQRDGLLDLVRQSRERGKTVVVGGPYPTSLPEEVLAAGCDFLVRGEGENTIPLLLDALAQGKKSGVFENPSPVDMSTSPIPRFDLLNLDHYVAVIIQTSRGCVFDCEFCEVVTLYGNRPRYKSPEQVIAELDAIYATGRRGDVFICDDNFIAGKGHARSILRSLLNWNEDHGKPFSYWTQASVNLGQDLDLIDEMTAACFSTVFVGIETPDEDVLRRSRKMQNVRNPLVESLNNMRDNGLSVSGSFVIGFDGEKPDIVDRLAAFMEATHLPIFQMVVLQAPPRTKLWHRLRAEGRLLSESMTTDWIMMRPNFITDRPEIEILKDFARLWEHLYEPRRFLKRAYNYYLAMRPPRAAMAASAQLSTPMPQKDKPRHSLREVLRVIPGFARLCWSQGVRLPCRFQFWKQFIGMRIRNPSRLFKYVQTCGIGEDMFRIRDTIMRRIRELDKRDSPAE